MISGQRAVVGFALTPADGSEREVAEGLLGEHGGQFVLGDNGYSGKRFRKELSEKTAIRSGQAHVRAKNRPPERKPRHDGGYEQSET